ncbi:lipoprotein [Methylotenera sp.]|nr:lipoprotein [Methylotenera sp.]MDI1298858.1 lipoprotein [Methylotenera sp.]
MKKNTVNILLLLSVCFAMNACGTKGPLYIPEQEYPQAAQANK